MKIPIIISTCLFLLIIGTRADKAPVVALYYESLCPGCHDFIMQQLAPVYQQLEAEIQVELIPYGNAKMSNSSGKVVVTCQHGPEECYGNVVQACLLAQKGTTAEGALTFITCMIEQPNPDDAHTAAQKCATDLKLDWPTLSACANGSQGLQLIEANANRTGSLVPAHQYVPWIVINGDHTEDMENRALANLLKLLCENYLNKDHLPQCKSQAQVEYGISAVQTCTRDDEELEEEIYY